MQHKKYLLGPEIISLNINPYTTSIKNSIKLKGIVSNTKIMSLNQRNIILEKHKNFEEIIVFSPGNNIIEIRLVDPFGKEKKYTYNVYLKGVKKEFPKTLIEAKNQQDEKIDQDQ